MNKNIHILLLGALLLGAAPVVAEETPNLILNPSFETFEHKDAVSFFPAYDEFEKWDKQGYCTFAETNDKIDGAVALSMAQGNTAGYVYQEVDGLTDDYYKAGREFELILHYKATKVPSGGQISLDSYWKPKLGGDADAMKTYDADVLQRVLATAPDSEWQRLRIVTTRPNNAKSLFICIKGSKNTTVLIDSLSLRALPDASENEPFITVSPIKLSSVSTTIGNTVDFTTLHITQGNLTGPTTFELSGYNPDQFTLSATSLSASESECDLVVTYAPKSAGNHSAILNIDNVNHTTLFQSITLSASCVDPSLKPTITVTPSVLPTFTAVTYQQAKQTIHVKSENCTDFVYMKVEHVTGAAFTIYGSMFSKNFEGDVEITFSPQEAGNYQSTLTISTDGAASVVVTLNGTASAPTPETVDWKTDFQWSSANPYKLLNEKFDAIEHNKTLLVKDWQNIAKADQRPWWGFDEAKTSPVRGEGKYAKATAYRYQQASSGNWEMWLVTPALDYKNAKGKIFTFSVMGEYLPEDGSDTKLEVYYIDPYSEATVYKQDLTESFDIPAKADNANTWCTFFLDLAPYAETMADVFHMAFRYLGPNGDAGVVTYYIDNVTWGRTDLPVITPSITQVVETATVNELKAIASFSVSAANLTESIQLEVKGSNYNKFKLSNTSLPKEGGIVAVGFESDQVGVHEAYIRLSSAGAVDAYIPMSVLCSDGSTRVEGNHQSAKSPIIKLIGNGQLLIIRDNKIYNAQGVQIK